MSATTRWECSSGCHDNRSFHLSQKKQPSPEFYQQPLKHSCYRRSKQHVYDPESANGYYRFPSGGDSSNIVEQLNEEENGTEIKLLEWNATAAVNLLPLFNPKNPNMVLKSQVTVSQYQVDKFNGWFIPSTYGPNVNSGVAGKGIF